MKTTSIIVHQTMSIDCPHCGHYMNDTYEKEIFNKLIDIINEIGYNNEFAEPEILICPKCNKEFGIDIVNY